MEKSLYSAYKTTSIHDKETTNFYFHNLALPNKLLEDEDAAEAIYDEVDKLGKTIVFNNVGTIIKETKSPGLFIIRISNTDLSKEYYVLATTPETKEKAKKLVKHFEELQTAEKKLRTASKDSKILEDIVKPTPKKED